MSKHSADHSLTSRERVGIVYVARGNRVRSFQAGMLVRLDGPKGIWRIMWIENLRYEPRLEVKVRKEATGEYEVIDARMLLRVPSAEAVHKAIMRGVRAPYDRSVLP